jgi:zinc transporter ZupT
MLLNKLILGCLIISVDIIGIVLPIIFSKWMLKRSNLSAIVCVAGGLLFSTSVLQLLSEAEGSNDVIDKDGNAGGFPLIHFIAVLGFICTMLSQNIMKIIKERKLEVGLKYEVLSGKTEIYSFTEINLKEGENELEEKRQDRSLAYIFFIVSLIESILSGLSIGLQQKDKSLFVLAISIISHDWIEAMVLVISFFPIRNRKDQYYVAKYSAAFCLATPLGIILGSLLVSYVSQYIADVLSGVSIAFISGVFMYISIVEMISKEFHESSFSYGINLNEEEPEENSDNSKLVTSLFGKCNFFNEGQKAKSILERTLFLIVGFILSTGLIYIMSFIMT